MVDFHGCTLPRGWERTYPHLMSMEAVQGRSSTSSTRSIRPRQRGTTPCSPSRATSSDPMDYTPVTFSDSRFPHLTTYGHELALSVVFESGLQHYADSVEAYRALPPEALDVPEGGARGVGRDEAAGGRAGQAGRRGTTEGQRLVHRRDQRDRHAADGDGQPRRTRAGPAFTRDGLGRHGPRALTSAAKTVPAGATLTVDLLPRGGFVARVRSSHGWRIRRPFGLAGPVAGQPHPSSAPQALTRGRRLRGGRGGPVRRHPLDGRRSTDAIGALPASDDGARSYRGDAARVKVRPT